MPSVVFVTLIPPGCEVDAYSIRVKYTRSSRVTVSQGSDWYDRTGTGIRMFVENVSPRSAEYAKPTRSPPPAGVGASFHPT